jgi:hypothetical protein
MLTGPVLTGAAAAAGEDAPAGSSPGSEWIRLGGPAARFGHTIIFNESTDRAILFGGDLDGSTRKNDVWLLTGSTSGGAVPVWKEIVPADFPPAHRRGHTAVYAEASNRMIVFGGWDGTYYSDVWILTSANGLGGTPTWVELIIPGIGPTPRTEHSAAYDAASNRLIVYGGDVSGTITDEVWVLSNANGLGGTPSWSLLPIPAGPKPERQMHTAIYDPVSNKMTTFAGWNSTAFNTDEVWVLSGANGLGGAASWQQLAPAGTAPEKRNEHVAAYSASSSRMVVFGGFWAGSTRFNDAWYLVDPFGVSASTEWFEMLPAAPLPPERDGHAAVYNASGNVLAVHGGRSLSDVWSLAGADGSAGVPAWTKLLSQFAPPPARSGSSAVMDVSDKRLTVFGGYSVSTGWLNRVWVLYNATGIDGAPDGPPFWTEIFPIGTPPTSRTRHSAVYDSANNVMIAFGGFATGSTRRNDTWTLSNANGAGTPAWTQLAPSTFPPPRRDGHAAVYNASTNRMVVFGGEDASGLNLNDVWVLTEANGLGGAPQWIQLLPGGPLPSPRTESSATYDAATNRMIVSFGGGQSDVWVLIGADGTGPAPQWVQLTPTGGPPAGRYRHAAGYDPALNTLVVAGGTNPTDAWILENANGLGGAPAWKQLSPAGGPPSTRYRTAGAYDPGSGRLVLFGGENGPAYMNDVWVLTEANIIPVPSEPGAAALLVALALPALFAAAGRKLVGGSTPGKVRPASGARS